VGQQPHSRRYFEDFSHRQRSGRLSTVCETASAQGRTLIAGAEAPLCHDQCATAATILRGPPTWLLHAWSSHREVVTAPHQERPSHRASRRGCYRRKGEVRRAPVRTLAGRPHR
jgi:hypothetical protein